MGANPSLEKRSGSNSDIDSSRGSDSDSEDTDFHEGNIVRQWPLGPLRVRNKGIIQGTWQSPAYLGEDQALFLNRRRDFFVWRHTQGLFAHHALGLSYDTSIDDMTCLRFLKAEVKFSDAAGLMLLFEGPCKAESQDIALDHREYSKNLECNYSASLQEVQQICRDVYDGFGDYNEWANNCQHFVAKIIDRLKPLRHPSSAVFAVAAPKDYLSLPIASSRATSKYTTASSQATS